MERSRASWFVCMCNSLGDKTCKVKNYFANYFLRVEGILLFPWGIAGFPGSCVSVSSLNGIGRVALGVYVF